jgi:hypothetical protein
MDAQIYTALADQVARQTPELAALDSDIADKQPNVDALQATADAAQAAFDGAPDEDKPAAQEALTQAQEALAGPKSELDGIKAQADAIRAAIAQCQGEMAASGLTVDTDAVRLADAKALMTDRIKAERDRRQQDGGVKVGANWFLSSDREAGRYNSLIGIAVAAGAPGDFVLRAAWRTMVDGVTQDMTPNLARQILSAGMTQFAAIDDAALVHIAAMEASADPLAYDYSAGWPAVFA